MVVGMQQPSSLLYLPNVLDDSPSGTQTTEELGVFPEISCLDFDDKNLVAGVGTRICIFEPFASRKASTCIQQLKGHIEEIRCIQMDQKIIISAGEDCAIRIWSRNSPSKSIASIRKAHDDRIYHLQFNDHKLVTSSADSDIKIWDLRTHKLLQTITGHDSNVYTFQFDQWKLVSGGYDNTVRTFDMSKGISGYVIRDEDPVEVVRFCGDILASASAWTESVSIRDFSSDHKQTEFS